MRNRTKDSGFAALFWNGEPENRHLTEATHIIESVLVPIHADPSNFIMMSRCVHPSLFCLRHDVGWPPISDDPSLSNTPQLLLAASTVTGKTRADLAIMSFPRFYANTLEPVEITRGSLQATLKELLVAVRRGVDAIQQGSPPLEDWGNSGLYTGPAGKSGGRGLRRVDGVGCLSAESCRWKSAVNTTLPANQQRCLKESHSRFFD